MSVRIAENGAKTKKLWLKQDSRGLFVKVLKEQGFWVKRPRAKIRLNLNFRD